jgi:hypothetical protein
MAGFTEGDEVLWGVIGSLCLAHPVSIDVMNQQSFRTAAQPATMTVSGKNCGAFAIERQRAIRVRQPFQSPFLAAFKAFRFVLEKGANGTVRANAFREQARSTLLDATPTRLAGPISLRRWCYPAHHAVAPFCGETRALFRPFAQPLKMVFAKGATGRSRSGAKLTAASRFPFLHIGTFHNTIIPQN